jgi:hypothetical protein
MGQLNLGLAQRCVENAEDKQCTVYSLQPIKLQATVSITPNRQVCAGGAKDQTKETHNLLDHFLASCALLVLHHVRRSAPALPV